MGGFSPFAGPGVTAVITTSILRSGRTPEDPTVGNYVDLFERLDFARYFFNTTLVAVAVTLGNLLFSAMLGYALAKLDFPGKTLLFALVLIALILPHEVLSLPLFILGYQLGVLNSYAALIFPYVVSPFGIFLFRQFFKTIPDDVVHAARLDGLTELPIVWKIMVPMALPAITLPIRGINWRNCRRLQRPSTACLKRDLASHPKYIVNVCLS